MDKPKRKSKTGIPNVDIYRGKFRSKVTIGGKQMYLGSFDTVDEAAQIVKDAKEKVKKKTHHKALNKEDLTGKRFGKLVVIREIDRVNPRIRNLRWLCRCDCGNETAVLSNKLKSGHTKSCGCIRDEQPLLSILEESRVDGVRTANLMSKTRSDSSTGVKGVRPRVDKEGFVSYIAYITIKGKRIHLGVFDNLTAAAGARRRAEEEYHKPYINALKEIKPMKTYNMTEIAAILNVSRQAVRSRYERAAKNNYSTFPKQDGVVGKVPFWNHQTLVDSGIIKEDNPS